MPASCARSSARPRRRCSSPRATSTTAPLQRGEALQERRARLSVFALLQPDRDDVRAAHGRARRRAGRARDRDRHGGGHHRADGPGQGRRSRRGRRRRCSAPAATWSRTTCRATASPRRWSTAPISTQWRKAVRPNTEDLLPGEPDQSRRSRCSTSQAIAEIAHAAGATLVVDNVFSTPLFQRPLELGADCVVYSATKHIDGQGRCLGGVILGSEKFIQDHIHNLIRQTGPSLSPFNAWVLLKGLETLCGARAPADRHRGDGRGRARRASQGLAPDLSGPAGSSAGRHRAPADARRLDAGRLRGQGRQGRRPSAFRTRSSSCASATISATPRA